MSISDKAKKLVVNIGGDIKDYLKKYPLEDIYNYNIVIESVLFENDNNKIKKINESNSNFERIKELRKFMNNKLKNVPNIVDYYIWIVKDFGGIKAFKRGMDDKKEEIKNDIDNFINCLQTFELDRPQFNTISSYSKIVSFLDPQKYFIYDSRVAFVLNWILLKNYRQENRYFHVPHGRNQDLTKYNIDTIINLYNKNDHKEYYNKKDVYFIYCEFINMLFEEIKNEKINEKISEPYYIEMIVLPTLNLHF